MRNETLELSSLKCVHSVCSQKEVFLEVELGDFGRRRHRTTLRQGQADERRTACLRRIDEDEPADAHPNVSGPLL